MDILRQPDLDPKKPMLEICPNCGSDQHKKNGHTKAGSQKLRCKQCGKSWTPGKQGNGRPPNVSRNLLDTCKAEFPSLTWSSSARASTVARGSITKRGYQSCTVSVFKTDQGKWIGAITFGSSCISTPESGLATLESVLKDLKKRINKVAKTLIYIQSN